MEETLVHTASSIPNKKVEGGNMGEKGVRQAGNPNSQNNEKVGGGKRMYVAFKKSRKKRWKKDITQNQRNTSEKDANLPPRKGNEQYAGKTWKSFRGSCLYTRQEKRKGISDEQGAGGLRQELNRRSTKLKIPMSWAGRKGEGKKQMKHFVVPPNESRGRGGGGWHACKAGKG